MGQRLSSLLGLFALLALTGSPVLRGANILPEAWLQASDRHFNGGFGIAVAVSEDTVIASGRDNVVYILVRAGGAWTEQARLAGPDGSFGWSVAISGDTAVIGAPTVQPGGSAFVYVREGTSWIQQGHLTAPVAARDDQFGRAVAISGNTIVVGTPFEAGAAGAVHVFVRTGTSWTHQAALRASNANPIDQFGSSVAIEGSTLVVGARGEASRAAGVNGEQGDNSAPFAGAAYVFGRNGGLWTQQAYLKASNPDAQDHFGDAVAISGGTIVVASPYERSNATGVNGNQNDNSLITAGAAYVFVRQAGSWTQQAYLKASNTDANDNFGLSVGISGETVVVGAQAESSGATGVNGNQSANNVSSAGAAYVFIRQGGSWSQLAYLKSERTRDGGRFGLSLGISDNTIAVGAPGEGRTEGAVSVFRGIGLPPADSDGDGVLNSEDECPETLPGSIVDATGCSIDQLVPCDGPWRNHGQFLQALKDVTRDFVDAGLITAAQRDRLLRAGSRSDCGKR